MSSIFDIVISFVAALIAAAFAHFGASEIPAGRNLPATTPPEASSYAPPTLAAPVSSPQAPEAPAAPQPISDIHADKADAEAQRVAMIAEQAEYEAEMSAHEAEMKAHEAQLKAFEAQIEARIEAAHRKAETRSVSNLSFQIDGKVVSGISPDLPPSFDIAIPTIDVAALEAAHETSRHHAKHLELIAEAACKAAEAARLQQMATHPAQPSGDVVL